MLSVRAYADVHVHVFGWNCCGWFDCPFVCVIDDHLVKSSFCVLGHNVCKNRVSLWAACT